MASMSEGMNKRLWIGNVLFGGNRDPNRLPNTRYVQQVDLCGSDSIMFQNVKKAEGEVSQLKVDTTIGAESEYR
jgi:hypothetical protein